MKLQYVGLEDIKGPIIVIDHVKDIAFGEVVEIELDDGTLRRGGVIEIIGEKAVIQVYEGTQGLSLENTKTAFLGHPIRMGLSKEVLGRIFNGTGEPIDGLGPIFIDEYKEVYSSPLNPISRVYPKNYIHTGISTIDALTTLIRGQKLPIFSDSGMPHNELAVQIVNQARISEEENDNFCIVFVAMGVKNDVADYFKRSFEEAGVLDKVVMFLNLSNDPIVERIITPRCALTTAEYLAFKHDMHVLVIMTDVTSYCEALREFSSSKGEIPGRKGFPGYLYSDLASIFERAGIIEQSKGSITQIPILTMPNNDITHPIPDLTGYITEGQIVLDSDLKQRGIYPPMGILPSLSRLMKDGIGAGYTREDHQALANQIFASYAKVSEARSLASVIGEDELSPIDKEYIEFGRLFEDHFINQGFTVSRTIDETLDLGWKLLSILSKEELSRIEEKYIQKFYNHKQAIEDFNIKGKSIIIALKEIGD